MTIYCLEENKTLTNLFAYNHFARIHETAKSSKIGFVRKLLPAKLNITVFCPVVDSEGFYGKLNPFKPDFTLSSSSTTSRELLSQFSTCSG